MSSAQYNHFVKKIKDFLKNPSTLEHLEFTYQSALIDIKKNTIKGVSQKFYQFPQLFEEKSVLGKILFSEKVLPLLDTSYLEKLENFLDDLNNPDNLLGEGFQESYLMLMNISTDGKIKTKFSHLDGPGEGVVIKINPD